MKKILLWLLLTLLAASCRDTRGDEGVAERVDEPRNEQAAESVDRAGGEEVLDPASTVAEAESEVERARLLALPIVPLAADRIQGVALPTYPELPDLEYEDMVERVKAVGATHVSIVVSWNQRTIRHNRLFHDPHTTPPDARIGAVIDAAHDAGLKVMVFPILHVEQRNKGEWRGKLEPTDWDRWKESYTEFVLHYGRLAARHGVEIYSVGSELSSLEEKDDFWRSIIDAVRVVYDGKLIYSANWDHYDHPTFWDELDYIGVSSYFEIAERNDEPVHVMSGRWARFRNELLAFASNRGKPLILTEVGYPSIDSSAVKPWDYTAKTPPNENAQLAAFRSMTDTWSLPPEKSNHFAGLFIWHGWGHGGPEDISYTIWRKHSHDLVREWYRN